MFEIWQYMWWGWLIVLAIFFIGFASQHMKFSKTLAYVVGILLIYFFVIKHPIWGSIWFVLSFIFTTGIYWPGITLFKMGVGEIFKQQYKDVYEAQAGIGPEMEGVSGGLPQFRR